MTLTALTLHEAHDLLRRKEVSALELTQAALARIEAVDPQIKAFITVTAERALDQARAADARRAAGEDHPLLGMPLAIKDVICTRGIPTTAGSRILENFAPPYDAHVVERLQAVGAVILGKTNTDEFAMGSSTENSAFFTTRNPWDTARVPGGSSGGSAAAIAAAMAFGALGSDTGGSIRQPAALCGVAGLKPTYGRVSRYGLIAFASSLDQIGPFAKCARDVAILLQTIAGHDARDATCMDAPVPDYEAHLALGVKGLRIGVPDEYFIQGIQPAVEQAVRAAVRVLEALGATADRVSLPHTDYGLPTYYLIAPAEASANLARYDGVRYGYATPDAADLSERYRRTRAEGFGAEVKRRIMIGTYALSAGYYDAYYLRAQKMRTLIKQDFERALDVFDVLVCPATPTTAFKIGAKTANPIEMYLEDVLTLPLNLAGLTGAVVPCGFENGLPIGLQIIGKALDEATVLRVAHAFEQATEWHRRRPVMSLSNDPTNA
ncbi:MAG: Asp-tRNA(Asn)/Glu-tRNA(Gln) amidotransferase subunit GatA [Chloroflexi bacterium]|nr:Asp-tRNA(Asn)/Glu-tRNA(Gln) amidotransferase subunit GatA [Chloroflexota bacterium]